MDALNSMLEALPSLENALRAAAEYAPRLGAAAAIALVGWVAAILGRRGTRAMMSRVILRR